MSDHRFIIGQAVHFSPGIYADNSTRGLYRIIRLVPVEHGMPQYRIKSETDGHERIAQETQFRPLKA